MNETDPRQEYNVAIDNLVCGMQTDDGALIFERVAALTSDEFDAVVKWGPWPREQLVEAIRHAPSLADQLAAAARDTERLIERHFEDTNAGLVAGESVLAVREKVFQLADMQMTRVLAADLIEIIEERMQHARDPRVSAAAAEYVVKFFEVVWPLRHQRRAAEQRLARLERRMKQGPYPSPDLLHAAGIASAPENEQRSSF